MTWYAAILAALAVASVTFILTAALVWIPRIAELEERWKTERDRRIAIEDQADAQREQAEVRIVDWGTGVPDQAGIDWDDQ